MIVLVAPHSLYKSDLLLCSVCKHCTYLTTKSLFAFRMSQHTHTQAGTRTHARTQTHAPVKKNESQAYRHFLCSLLSVNCHVIRLQIARASCVLSWVASTEEPGLVKAFLSLSLCLCVCVRVCVCVWLERGDYVGGAVLGTVGGCKAPGEEGEVDFSPHPFFMGFLL